MRAIAWIASPQEPPASPGALPLAGRWGPPETLGLPLADRGLQLGDGLFETICVEARRAHLLDEHLARWHTSAHLLGMAPPPKGEVVERLLGEAIRRSGITGGALRLNWSRGLGRGISLPGPGDPAPAHRFWLQLTAAEPCFEPVRAIVSTSEQRNAASLQSRCKTFAYGASIQARREARAAGADDALLLSTAGGLCCGTTANLLVFRGRRWQTPRLASGCLPGVMRGRALQLGKAEEGRIEPGDLGGLPDAGEPCQGAAVLINSLGCRAIVSLNGRPLPPWRDVEGLWRSLLRK